MVEIRPCFANDIQYGNVLFYTVNVNSEIKIFERLRNTFKTLLVTFRFIQTPHYFVKSKRENMSVR